MRFARFVTAITVCLATACTEPAVENNSAGPVAAEEVSLAEATIPVEGMTCSGCENFIKQTLESTDGVRQATASHIERVVQVSYDPARTSPEKIVEAINKTQYKAHMPGTILQPASAPTTPPGEAMH